MNILALRKPLDHRSCLAKKLRIIFLFCRCRVLRLHFYQAMVSLRAWILCCTLLLPFVYAVSDVDTEVLNLLNEYRVNKVNIAPLSYNSGAACVASQVLLKFVNQACTNTTGADTSYGKEVNFPDFPDMLAKCSIALENVSAGYIAPDCIPSADFSDPAAVAVSNITHAQLYQIELNSTTYTSAGVASSGIWYVVALGTNTSDGNFGTTAGVQADSNGGGQLISFLSTILIVVCTALSGTL